MSKLPLTQLLKMLDDGYSIITVGDKKQPNFKWKSCQTSALAKDELTRLYNSPTTQGQGYCTGYNNIEVIDVDLKIYESLARQQEVWNELLSLLQDNIADFENKFVIYKTVSNGYHIIYKCSEVGGNVKLATPKGYTQALIETRGKGGYCFIYDNQVSKLSYSQVKEISVDDRLCLMAICKLFHHEEAEEINPKQKVNEAYSPNTTPWEDYNQRHDVFFVIHDEFKVVRRLSDKTLILRNGSDAAHSGYVYHDSGVMYLFTTGTIYPYEKALRPFDLYVHKYHSGDYSQAAKQLYKEGYGDRVIRKIEAIETPPKEITADFPLDVFPTNIQNYIIECHNTLNSSIDYMGCAMLWNLSIIVGNSMRVVVKPGWAETPVLWIALVGRAGVGKTPSTNNILFPLERANSTEIKNFIRLYERYQEYNELSKKDKDKVEEVRKPKRTQFIANDVTLEALVEMHSENKNAVGVFKDELAGWLKDMNKYRAGSDLEFWLSSWSAKGVSINRKTATSAFIQCPHIPVIGGIQPGVLNSFFTQENKANGFVDRILTCSPDLKVDKFTNNSMNPDILEWYESFVVNMYKVVRGSIAYDHEGEITPAMVKMSGDAYREFIRIHDEITALQNSEDESEYFKTMLPKQKSYIPRFSLLINVYFIEPIPLRICKAK